MKRGRVRAVETVGAESEGENQCGPRCRGGGVGRGESEGPSQKGRCGDVNALAG